MDEWDLPLAGQSSYQRSAGCLGVTTDSSVRIRAMLCASQWAVGLISVVVFRFRHKGVKLSRGGISLKLVVPSGCIEFRKPAPELRQVRGGESFDSLLQGFHIGHGLFVRFTAHQSDANCLASPPLKPPTPLLCQATAC